MKTWSADLADAHPVLAELAGSVMTEFAAMRAPQFLRITRVWGSQAVQEALWAQGRTSLPVVNDLRRAVGLPPITDEANKSRVTWTKSSKHTRKPSEAVDFVVAEDPDGPGPLKATVTWKDEPAYLALGEIAERHGLVWGGRFKRYDGAHVEMRRESAAQREE